MHHEAKASDVIASFLSLSFARRSRSNPIQSVISGPLLLVILSPSLHVILSEAKNLTPLRVNSPKNLIVPRIGFSSNLKRLPRLRLAMTSNDVVPSHSAGAHKGLPLRWEEV